MAFIEYIRSLCAKYTLVIVYLQKKLNVSVSFPKIIFFKKDKLFKKDKYEQRRGH